MRVLIMRYSVWNGQKLPGLDECFQIRSFGAIDHHQWKYFGG